MDHSTESQRANESAFTILGQGSAVPHHSIGQKESVQIAVEHFCPSDKERRLLPALYRMAGVKKRHSVLLRERGPDDSGPSYDLMYEPEGPDDMGPRIGERMRAYEDHAGPLAAQAAKEAIDKAGSSAADISHLVTVSCSGFDAPGVDVGRSRDLGLPPTVERAHIGFMGCQGAMNGLRVARGFAASSPGANVLLCAVELCSIHYHYGWDPERVVANALFADGAAAVVGTMTDKADGWPIQATGACLIPDSEDAMTWRIRDNGFEMSLSSRVPKLIEEHLGPWMETWLAGEGLQLADIESWAVHPGGPRILSSVSKALDLPDGALEVSRGVLQEFGNMSSPTILFIVDRMRTAKAPLPCVALAFGPGLMAEAVLFA